MPLEQPTTVVTLPGGRRLAADDVGDPAGEVVVYLHGAPDCRIARHPDDEYAASLGVRLVAVDRPGTGASDPDPALTFASFGDDLGALLDALGVGRCRLVAWSAGGPWALTAAAVLGRRVSAVTIFGGVAPLAAFEDPDVATDSGGRALVVEAMLDGESTPFELAEEIATALVPAPPIGFDLAREHVVESLGSQARAEVEQVPGGIDMLARSLVAALEQHGVVGLRRDFELQLTAAGQELLLTPSCPVRVINGEHDHIAGPAVGRWFAANLPNATAEVWPDAGHYALFGRWSSVLGAAGRV